MPGPAIQQVISTPTALPSVTFTASVTPTATPVPLNPLTIEYLREREYPASDLIIEETLEVGPNYFATLLRINLMA